MDFDLFHVVYIFTIQVVSSLNYSVANKIHSTGKSDLKLAQRLWDIIEMVSTSLFSYSVSAKGQTICWLSLVYIIDWRVVNGFKWFRMILQVGLASSVIYLSRGNVQLEKCQDTSNAVAQVLSRNYYYIFKCLSQNQNTETKRCFLSSGEPDPDPTPFLSISWEDKQKDMAKVIAFTLNIFMSLVYTINKYLQRMRECGCCSTYCKKIRYLWVDYVIRSTYLANSTRDNEYLEAEKSFQVNL